jgi:hypothetical protein
MDVQFTMPLPFTVLQCGAKEHSMPLRDHFRPPVESKHSWDKLHGGWPAIVVQHLFPILPEAYMAAPRVHLGPAFVIDDPSDMGGGAVATWAPPKPTLTLETELPDQDEYEVRVYDVRHGRRLLQDTWFHPMRIGQPLPTLPV